MFVCEGPEPRGSSVPRDDGVGLLRDIMDCHESEGDRHLIAEVLPANRGGLRRLVPARVADCKDHSRGAQSIRRQDE